MKLPLYICKKFATWIDLLKASEHFTFPGGLHRSVQITAITAWQTPGAYNWLAANTSNTILCKTTQRADEVSVASAINLWVALLYNRKFVMFFFVVYTT